MLLIIDWLAGKCNRRACVRVRERRRTRSCNASGTRLRRLRVQRYSAVHGGRTDDACSRARRTAHNTRPTQTPGPDWTNPVARTQSQRIISTTCTGWAKMAQCTFMPITLGNINRLSNFFTVGIRIKFAVTLSPKIPPYLICVATLPCEMSDIAFKPAMIPTYCVINIDRAWRVLPNSPNLNPMIMLFEGPSTEGLSTSTIHIINQLKQMMSLIGCLHDPANVQQTSSNSRVFWIHLLEVCWTFAGSCKHRISAANCRSIWLIAPLVSGVAGLNASSSSKADTLNIWCENCEMWQLVWTITETKISYNVLLQISSCFQLLFLKHWYFAR